MSFIILLRIQIVRWVINLNEWIYFYPKLRKFYKNNVLKKDPVIFDVGSNRGQSIDFFSNLFPLSKIYGFEPNRKLFDKLKQKYTSIILYNFGISNETGSMMFFENILDETSSFQAMNYDSAYTKKKAKVLGVEAQGLVLDTYKVKVLALADLLIQEKIDHVDIIKIDVEGHEFMCLQGLFSKPHATKIEFIQIESHADSMYKNYEEEIAEILKKNGFQLLEKIKHGFGDFYELVFQNESLL